MYCKKCGSYLPDDSIFCSSCGTSTSDDAPAQTRNYQNSKYSNNKTSKSKNDVFCSLGFCFSMLLSGLVGVILSIIGVNRTSKNGTAGKGWGIAGIAVGIVRIVIIVPLILIAGVSRYLKAAKANVNTTPTTANYLDVFETDSTTDTPDFSSVFESVNESAKTSFESELNDSLRLSSIFGNTYINNLFDFSCTLDGWSFYSDEQIAELNKISVEEVTHTGKNLPKGAGDIFYDMEAEKTDVENGLYSSVAIKYIKLSSSTTSESRYSGLCYDATVDGLISKGYTIIHSSNSDYSLAGINHSSYYIEATSDSITVYQRVISVKSNDYMCDIIVTCAGGDNTEEILASFH